MERGEGGGGFIGGGLLVMVPFGNGGNVMMWERVVKVKVVAVGIVVVQGLERGCSW